MTHQCVRKPEICRLIREKQYDQALEIARGMVQDGAHIIDINMDDALLDAPEAMKEFYTDWEQIRKLPGFPSCWIPQLGSSGNRLAMCAGKVCCQFHQA